MPNHVTNVVNFRGSSNRIAELLKKVKGKPWAESDPSEVSHFDFEKIVPPPENLHKGSIGFDDMKKLANQGIPNWYDWNCENWGTKWNAYDIVVEGETIKFDTAWSMPHPVFLALSEQFPDLEIHVEYADEDLGHNCGKVIYKGGDVILDWDPGNGSKHALDFAANIKYGCSYDELGWDDE